MPAIGVFSFQIWNIFVGGRYNPSPYKIVNFFSIEATTTLTHRGIHLIRHNIQNLGEFGGMVLADCKYDGFSNFCADRITQGIFQKGFAKYFIGNFGKEFLFKLALFVGLFLSVAIFINDFDNQAIF